MKSMEILLLIACGAVVVLSIVVYLLLSFFSKKVVLAIEGMKAYQYETTKHLNKNVKPPMRKDKETPIGYAHTPSKDVLGVIRGEYDEMFDQD